MAPTPEVWSEHAALMETLAVKPMLLVDSWAKATGSKPLRSGHPDRGLSLPSSCCPRTLSTCQEEHVVPQASPCSSLDYIVSKSPSVKERIWNQLLIHGEYHQAIIAIEYLKKPKFQYAFEIQCALSWNRWTAKKDVKILCTAKQY